jgi:S-formylglutathione hydrolase FrmB
MGGGGSFIYALHRPDLFSSACPLSAATGPITIEQASRWIGRISKETSFSKAELQNWFERYSTTELLKTMPVEEVKKVRWYIDCGDDDFLFEGNSLVHIAMKKKQIPHEYRVRDGVHSWSYWRSALPEVLAFVTEAFHQR